MSINISGGGVAGITIESDPTALKLTGGTLSGELNTPELGNILNTNLVIDSYNDTGAGTHYYHTFNPFDGRFILAPNGGGLTFPDGTTQSTATLQGPQGNNGANGTNGTPGGPEGPQGPQGNDGPSGPSGASAPPLVFKGEYNGGTTYSPYDVVYWSSTDTSYVMTTYIGAGYDPSNTSYWTLYNTGGNGNVYTTGATFTGKVNMAAPTAGGASLNLGVGTVPTTSVAGDIWIATNINFKDSSGTQKTVANTNTSNTYTAPQIIQTTIGTVNAALRVTQLGTGNAIQVEDSTTPDATPFVVDQFGKVGIGVAPDATAAITVDSTGIKFGANSTVQSISAIVTATGTYDKEIPIQINGVNYRIPCRQV